MKKLLFILLLLPSLVFGQSNTVAIDMGSNKGAPTYRAAGFLHGISQQYPPDSLLLPLNMKTYRGSVYYYYDIFSFYRRLKNLGVQDIYFLPGGYNDQPGEPNYGNDSANAAALAQRSLDSGFTFIWEPYNEPFELAYHPGWTYDSLKINFKKVVRGIKNVIPNAAIEGPALNVFDSVVIKNFLADMYSAGVAEGSPLKYVPSILSWHELLIYPETYNGIPCIYSNVPWMKTYLAAHPEYGDIKISLNEYIIMDRQGSNPNYYYYLYSPGSSVDYFAAAERFGIEMLRASWVVNNQASDVLPILGGVIGLDNYTPPPSGYDPAWVIKKRGPYWAHRVYGSMKGKMLDVTRNRLSDGVASVDSASGTALFLIGNRTGGGDVGNTGVPFTTTLTVQMNNIPAYLVHDGKVRARVEQIPYGEENLSSLPLVSEQDYTVTGNAATITTTLPFLEAISVSVLNTVATTSMTIKGKKISY